MNNEILLSFEITGKSDLEIHGNRRGFDVLAKAIQELGQHNINDHCHLFAADLHDSIIGENNVKIEHVKLMYWEQ